MGHGEKATDPAGWGETKKKRAFADRHASTAAYIDFMRPRCVELARVLKKSGSFYYHCDWHASHYVKVMPTSRRLSRIRQDSVCGTNQPVEQTDRYVRAFVIAKFTHDWE